MFTDLLVSISHGSLTFWLLGCEGVLRVPKLEQLSAASQTASLVQNYWAASCPGHSSLCATQETSPARPLAATLQHTWASLPAGRFGDLNQLPFSQQLKFFKEFSSISQLNIFKSLSSPTFPSSLHAYMALQAESWFHPARTWASYEVTGQAIPAESASLESSAEQPQSAESKSL